MDNLLRQQFKLGPQNISGQVIYFVDDSINNKVKISGQLVAVSGVVNVGNSLTIATLPTISVSGNTLAVSGSIAVNSLPVISVSGNAVRISGQHVSISGSIAINNTDLISGQTVRISGYCR